MVLGNFDSLAWWVPGYDVASVPRNVSFDKQPCSWHWYEHGSYGSNYERLLSLSFASKNKLNPFAHWHNSAMSWWMPTVANISWAVLIVRQYLRSCLAFLPRRVWCVVKVGTWGAILHPELKWPAHASLAVETGSWPPEIRLNGSVLSQSSHR